MDLWNTPSGVITLNVILIIHLSVVLTLRIKKLFFLFFFNGTIYEHMTSQELNKFQINFSCFFFISICSVWKHQNQHMINAVCCRRDDWRLTNLFSVLLHRQRVGTGILPAHSSASACGETKDDNVSGGGGKEKKKSYTWILQLIFWLNQTQRRRRSRLR